MVKLTNQRLKEILKKINTNPQTAQQYSSKLDRVLRFLNNNTGLKNAGIKEMGSQAKKTNIRTSDADIVFCTSPDQDHQVIRKYVSEKAVSAFGKAAKVKLAGKAIHIDFISPNCKFDLVYVTQKKFKEEIKKLKVIVKLRPMHKNAIKLAKYAFSKSNVRNIKSYEVEKACLTINSNNLPDCVTKIVHYFKGRIVQNNLTVNRILQRLI